MEKTPLRSKKKDVRRSQAVLVVLPTHMIDRFEGLASATLTSRSSVIRQACLEFLSRRQVTGDEAQNV